jgi:hypothetical protein
VRLFGPAKPPTTAGETQNIFGREDELKIAPKGIEKDHPDIDLLRCRSFAVVIRWVFFFSATGFEMGWKDGADGTDNRFTDSEVLDPEFKERLGEVAKVVRPFVRMWVSPLALSPCARKPRELPLTRARQIERYDDSAAGR